MPVDAGLEVVLGHSFTRDLPPSHSLLFSLSRCPRRGGGMVEGVGPGKLLSHFSLLLCGTRQNDREELTIELTPQGLVVTSVLRDRV